MYYIVDINIFIFTPKIIKGDEIIQTNSINKADGVDIMTETFV